MNDIEQLGYKLNAINEVDKELFFDDLKLDFVLVTQSDGRYIIGVNDDELGYLFKPYAKRKIKRYADIRFKSEARKTFYEECIECYILSCLCGKYELVSMSIDMHINIWSFINDYIDDVDFMLEKGVRKYLNFCKETGINRRLLETYGGIYVDDLFQVFLEDTEDEFITFMFGEMN